MAATGTARAKVAMTRAEAIELLNRMPYLVCTCSQRLLRDQVAGRPHNIQVRMEKGIPEQAVYETSFTVFGEGNRSYTFERQPFRIIREISRDEFLACAPWASTSHGGRNDRTFYYEIHTD